MVTAPTGGSGPGLLGGFELNLRRKGINMKTVEEIKAAVSIVYGGNEDNIEVEIVGDSIFVEVTAMYEKPSHGKSLPEFCKAMVDAVGLPDFEDCEDISSGGCETCDYGSCYGTKFRFFDPKN